MPLTFEIFDAESGVFTYPNEKYARLLEEFYDRLEEYESGQLGEKRYLAAMDRLLAEAPDFVHVHAHVAGHWHRESKPKKALETALHALGISNRLILEGFNGRVEWGISTTGRTCGRCTSH